MEKIYENEHYSVWQGEETNGIMIMDYNQGKVIYDRVSSNWKFVNSLDAKKFLGEVLTNLKGA